MTSSKIKMDLQRCSIDPSARELASQSESPSKTQAKLPLSLIRFDYGILDSQHVSLAGSEFDATGSGYGSSPVTSGFGGVGGDPFTSHPVPWNYCCLVNVTYLLIDYPSIEVKGEVYRLRGAFFPFIMQNATTFYAAMTFAGSVYHFRKNLPLESPLLLNLRQNAILGINESLSLSTQAEHAPDDHTIAAVFCMSLAESMYGDTNSYHMHMKGLQKMIQLRRGMQNLGLDGLLARMIRWLDHNHAKVHGSDLVFNESVQASREKSPFQNPRDPSIDTGPSQILR